MFKPCFRLNVILLFLLLKVWSGSSFIEEFKSGNKDHVFIDKSALIRKVMRSERIVYEVTRPHGFGKSINLAMLRHFLNREENSTKSFKGFDVMTDPIFCKAYQNKYPVMFVSFKDCGRDTYIAMVDQIKIAFAQLYQSHDYLLESIDSHEKQKFLNILHNNAKEIEIESVLLDLAKLLKAEFDKKPVLLIDDFDEPLFKAFLKGYHSQAVSLIGNIFSAVLENEQILQKAVLTGVSSLNLEMGITNVVSDTVVRPIYSTAFGFTNEEVKRCIIASRRDLDLKDFYDRLSGYRVGRAKLYNPLSVVNAISKGRVSKFWTKNPMDSLGKKLAMRVGMAEKVSFDLLCANQPIQKAVLPNLYYNEELYSNETFFWSFFVHVGYLNALYSHNTSYINVYSLKTPNPEITDALKSAIVSAIPPRLSSKRYRHCLNALKAGDMKIFFNEISSYIGDCGSYQRMRSYDSYVRTILSAFYEEYDIIPKKEPHWMEAGFSVTMFPKDKTEDGILFNFRLALIEPSLQRFAGLAVADGANQHTAQVFFSRGYNKVLIIGMSFAERCVGMNFTRLVKVSPPEPTTLSPLMTTIEPTRIILL